MCVYIQYVTHGNMFSWGGEGGVKLLKEHKALRDSAETCRV